MYTIRAIAMVSRAPVQVVAVGPPRLKSRIITNFHPSSDSPVYNAIYVIMALLKTFVCIQIFYFPIRGGNFGARSGANESTRKVMSLPGPQWLGHGGRSPEEFCRTRFSSLP